MQVTEILVTDTADEIRVTPFMPELVSVDELLMIADGYQARIEALITTLHQHDKGSEQHIILTDEMAELVRRRRFLVKTARQRRKLERDFTLAKAKSQR